MSFQSHFFNELTPEIRQMVNEMAESRNGEQQSQSQPSTGHEHDHHVFSTPPIDLIHEMSAHA